jgi:hypothetical protein
MLINQVLNRKLKGGDNDNDSIEWTRLQGNFQKWRYEFLKLLEPIEVQDVIIYLKLNKEEKLVNLYLLLTPKQAKDLEFNMGLRRLGNVMLYESEFDITHVNSLLSLFFGSDLYTQYFYSLSDTRYFTPEDVDIKWKRAVESFETSKEEENIQNIRNFKDIGTNLTSVERQKIISQERNEKIKEIFNSWIYKHSLTTLYEMFDILLLSNKRNVVELVVNRKNKITDELLKLSYKYNFEFQGSDSKFFKDEHKKFAAFFSKWDAERLSQRCERGKYNNEVNEMINGFIDRLADIVIVEFQRFHFFEYHADVILFYKYLKL